MKKLKRTVGVMILIGVTWGPAAQAEDEDVIEYRQHIMKTLEAQSAALGQILSGAVPDDNLVAHLDTLALTASTALRSFEPKVQGGESKPEVWAKWPDFSKRMKDFADKTAQTAKIAKQQGKEAATEHVMEALSCKSCHDVYRAKK
jgi:cytochrome c556